MSMVTVLTFDLGDIVPSSAWLRVVTPLEALFGFALLTVAVSWVLQIYPTLTRRRVLAIRLSVLRRADVVNSLQGPGSVMLPIILDNLSSDISQVGVDLREYSEIYYFQDSDPDASLPATLTYAVELGRLATTAQTADVRAAATLLNGALEEFVAVLRDRFRHPGQSVPDVPAAYAADHGHPLA